MSLLSRCPNLVTQLIAWYQWKAKISALNSEYKQEIEIYDIGKFFQLLFRKIHIFQYRSANTHNTNYFFFIKRISSKTKRIKHVAILPSKYFFTSGSHNCKGFLPIENDTKQSWLPDYFSQYI